MKNENKIIKIFRYFSLLLVIALGLISIIGTGGGGGGDGGVGGGGGTTSLATGEFTKTLMLTTSGTWRAPFDTNNIHDQQLYRAGDINGAGYIQSIELRLALDTTGCSCPDATIKMGHTSLGGLTTNYANNVQQGKGTLETVRAGAFNVPAGSAGDYIIITLDTPFLYNGVDNLVVEFLVTACDAAVNFWRDDTTLVNGMLHSFSLTNLTGTLWSNVLHTRFNFEGGTEALELASPGSGNTFPFGGSGRKVQLLYNAADINGSGPVTGIAMRIGSATTTDQSYTYTMRVGHSTLTDLTTDFNGNFSDTPVTVADNEVFKVPSGMPSGSYLWIPMPDGYFNYNGSDSLIVELDVSASSGTTEWLDVNTLGTTTRAYGNPGSATATGVDYAHYDIRFRFNGAPIDVITVENIGWNDPFSDNDIKTQILFDGRQLGTGGPVTGISFRLASGSSASDYPSATVVLEHTANTTLSTTFADNLTNPTTVFTGVLSVPAGLEDGDWVTIPVSGFTYDPIQNLMVEVTQNAGSVMNIIFSTNDVVPGASGMVTGPKVNPVATSSSPGQSDIRIYLSK